MSNSVTVRKVYRVPQFGKRPFGPVGNANTELTLLAAGMSDRAIGAELCISHHAVMRHVTAIFRNPGVNNRAAAAEIARGQLSYAATITAADSGEIQQEGQR